MCSAGACRGGCDTNQAQLPPSNQPITFGFREWGLRVGTENTAGSKWGVPTAQEQGGAAQELLGTLGLFGALGTWLCRVCGCSHSFGGCPLPGLVCVRDEEGMRGVLSHRRGFGLSLLEVGEDADGDDEGGQGDGVAHGVHEVQAVKHLLQEKD